MLLMSAVSTKESYHTSKKEKVRTDTMKLAVGTMKAVIGNREENAAVTTAPNDGSGGTLIVPERMEIHLKRPPKTHLK